MIGSVASLGPWGGSIAYFIGPPLWIRNIAQLKATRDCYVALDARVTNNKLLACGWKSDNSTLHFYLYSTKPNSSISLVKTLEIKPTQTSSGAEERAFSVKFLFGSHADLKVNRWTLVSNKWVEQEGKIFDLTGFCKSTSLSSFSGSGTKALTCKWGELEGQQETWQAFTQ
ncbi:hypothetical protein WEN_01855 [Mycoplasma wenyonii str. Massachusetts]|uniref:Uncharacterized protein n=2 Tax=Mycoplasma wenyonii TaxID=65123 RepID=I6YLI9_MYCWM|nr:hypothetical protein WEN_01855 [Mycoplasma wenyonii str. Massachusetts]